MLDNYHELIGILEKIEEKELGEVNRVLNALRRRTEVFLDEYDRERNGKKNGMIDIDELTDQEPRKKLAEDLSKEDKEQGGGSQLGDIIKAMKKLENIITAYKQDKHFAEESVASTSKTNSSAQLLEGKNTLATDSTSQPANVFRKRTISNPKKGKSSNQEIHELVELQIQEEIQSHQEIPPNYLPEEQDYLETSQLIEKNAQSESEKLKEATQTSQKNPLLVLITGGAASGKTTLTKQLKENLEQNQQEALILPLDAYYAYSPLLFQSPGKSIYLPTYDNSEEKKFTRSDVLINSSPVIILEGMLSFFNEEIRKKSDLKIYLEVADEIRLARRLERYKQGLDEGKFSKPIEYEIERFHKGKPKENQENYIEPAKQYADLVVNNDNSEGKVEEKENINIQPLLRMRKLLKKSLQDVEDELDEMAAVPGV
ncbi:64_t:CDS:2 [Ambispora gerdemannii]|uniref:64_t:CDS:1 n=1 Tax=Ambispora gerdemannii TaxID=144530 RepID=A0A9N9CG37_9GLOM|nr:64_t:CDS:2 [Ambispora gerdemannii]